MDNIQATRKELTSMGSIGEEMVTTTITSKGITKNGHNHYNNGHNYQLNNGCNNHNNNGGHNNGQYDNTTMEEPVTIINKTTNNEANKNGDVSTSQDNYLMENFYIRD